MKVVSKSASLSILVLVLHGPLWGEDPATRFLELEEPNGIDFDAAGNLFLGSADNSTSGSPIRFAPANGTAVVAVGQAIYDPDEVIVDPEGWLAEAGNVIVAAGRRLLELDPKGGTTKTLFSGYPVQNAAEMVFDDKGRLFIGQVGRNVLMVERGQISILAGFPGHIALAVTLDEAANLYVGLRDTGEVFGIPTDPPGTPWLVATVPGSLDSVEFATHGPFAGGLFVGMGEGLIYRIDVDSGQVELFLDGFGRANTVRFAPNGRMLVSDQVDHVIWAVPACSRYPFWDQAGCLTSPIRLLGVPALAPG